MQLHLAHHGISIPAAGRSAASTKRDGSCGSRQLLSCSQAPGRQIALKAIGRSAERLGLTAEAVLAAAPGVLDGRPDTGCRRPQLTERPAPPAAEPAAEAEGGFDPPAAALAEGPRRRRRLPSCAGPSGHHR